MKIQGLSLNNFRNYSKKSLEFSDKTSLFIGKNGVGKTNLLEAITILAWGKSFKAKRSEEMILYGQELSRISGVVNGDSLEVVLTIGKVQGERVQKKKYLINGVAKRKMDFIGKFRVVLFRPEDIDLALGSPSVRREYLDSVLEQIDRDYRRSNLSYQKGIRQRNKLLYRIREGEANRQQLLFWNKLLIKNGEVISQKREDYLDFVNKGLKEKGSDLSLKYERSALTEKRLSQYVRQEIAAAKTLVGPHRDDFLFISQRRGKIEKDLSIYGSRGEQRMAVFQVKLNELEYMDKVVEGEEDRPVLLLDDVFSELDKDHREKVFELLNRQQTIVTTSTEKLIPLRYKRKLEIVRL
jgi:DNA replication and repair protein RecF